MFLMVRTLQEIHREAEDTRAQLATHLVHQGRALVLTELQKRLDRALAEWTRLMDEPLDVIARPNGTGGLEEFPAGGPLARH